MKSYGRDSYVMISAKFFKKSFWVLFNLIYIRGKFSSFLIKLHSWMSHIFIILILEVSDVCKVLSKICFVRVFYFVLLKA